MQCWRWRPAGASVPDVLTVRRQAVIRGSTISMAIGGALLLAAPPMATAAPSDGDAVFKQIESLVGDWEGKTARGRNVRVEFKLVAGGSVLVETWDMGGGRTSMTVYHRDGAALMATHYCPLGNQPRLVLTDDAAGRFTFRFRDATNLASLQDEHADSFWLKLDGHDRLIRGETYLTRGQANVDEVTFHRVASR